MYMSKIFHGNFYIITDNFYPKKLSSYKCHTLSNINVKCLNNEVLVFNNRNIANRYLSLNDKNVGYHVEFIEYDDLKMICECFDLIPTYVK